MNKDSLTEEKKSATQSEAESAFWNTLEGRTFAHITKSLKDEKRLEAYLYCWALIEKVLLVNLLEFISRHLNMQIPKSLWNGNQQTINLFYLGVSQDTKLYSLLERGRKKRNNIIHDLIKKNETKKFEAELKVELLFLVDKLIKGMFMRLCGQETIPALAQYSRGWNDMRVAAIKIINGGNK